MMPLARLGTAAAVAYVEVFWVLMLMARVRAAGCSPAHVDTW